jgi:short-subunit dehydrogenase
LTFFKVSSKIASTFGFQEISIGENMKSSVCITGAAGGLGKAFAAECALRGWNLFLTDLAAPLLPPLAAGISRLYGVDVQTYACDLTNTMERDSFWLRIQELGIQFHMLINVAGVEFEGLFKERSLQELRTIVRLNIEATLEMTHRVLSHRDPCRTLRIINVSSLASYYPMPLKAVYAASKRFLLDVSLALHHELCSDDVTVTVLCPAGLPTTLESITKIDAQGFMGQATTLNVGSVTTKTIDWALKGRPVYIPGWVNRLMKALSILIPPVTIAGMLKKRWLKAYKESTADHRLLDLPPLINPH